MAKAQQALYCTGESQWMWCLGINHLSYELWCYLIELSLAPATHSTDPNLPRQTQKLWANVSCVEDPKCGWTCGRLCQELENNVSFLNEELHVYWMLLCVTLVHTQHRNVMLGQGRCHSPLGHRFVSIVVQHREYAKILNVLIIFY